LDIDDGAIFSSNASAATIDEAVEEFRESVMETRERYGGKDWRPVGVIV
jgi:hypothetical protein